MDSQFYQQQSTSALRVKLARNQVLSLPTNKDSDSSKSDFSKSYIQTENSLLQKALVKDTEKEELQSPLEPPTPYVLVVEDDMTSRTLIVSTLLEENVDFDLAKDDKEAIKKSTTTKYDLILMDINIPEIDGIEAAHIIRQADNPNKNTAIIAIIAFDWSEIDHKSLTAIDDFVSKPLSQQKFVHLLHKYVWGIFRFSKALDTNWLAEYYENNIEFAVGTFELFLNLSYEKFKAVKPVQKNTDLQVLRAALHKSKPSFKMVGLSELFYEIHAIEKQVEKMTDRCRKAEHIFRKNHSTPLVARLLDRSLKKNYTKVNKRLANLYESLEEKIPLIRHELKRMQNYLNQ